MHFAHILNLELIGFLSLIRLILVIVPRIFMASKNSIGCYFPLLVA